MSSFACPHPEVRCSTPSGLLGWANTVLGQVFVADPRKNHTHLAPTFPVSLLLFLLRESSKFQSAIFCCHETRHALALRARVFTQKRPVQRHCVWNERISICSEASSASIRTSKCSSKSLHLSAVLAEGDNGADMTAEESTLLAIGVEQLAASINKHPPMSADSQLGTCSCTFARGCCSVTESQQVRASRAHDVHCHP
eukprot:3127384-Rhodomonas_salina.1